jgi:putative peptidoglycan lipid II flippase
MKLEARPLARPIRQTSSGSLARSTVFVMAATIGSSLLGFILQLVNARYFGVSASLDEYLSASQIPVILFGVFNGALVSALVPAFSELVAVGEEESAWRLGSTIINGLFIVLALLAAIGTYFAPQIVPIVTHGFNAEKIAATVGMTRWLLPTIIATSLSGVVGSMLNAKHHFFAPALTGIVINLVTIVAVVALNGRLDIYALVIGSVLGLVAQLLVQFAVIVSSGMYRLVLDLRHPGFGKIFGMLGPIVIGSAAGQLALFFVQNFASTLGTGNIAAMNFATKLVGFPQQIFAAAIATVIFPLFAAQFARGDFGGVRRSVVTGLRLVLLVTVPSAIGLSALARPIVATLFQRGKFDADATALCASLLPYAASSLVGLAASIVLTRCCFACKETRLTVAISVFTVVLQVALSILWLPSLGARGLFLANSVSQWLQAALLLALVWRLAGAFDWRTLAISATRIAACSLLMGLGIVIVGSAFHHPATSFLTRLVPLLAQLAAGGLVFAAAVRVLRVQEIAIAYNLIVRKLEPSAAA